MTVTVELVGLCGAGKTTLAAKLSSLPEGTAGLGHFSRPLPSGVAAVSAAGLLTARMLRRQPSATASLLTTATGRQLLAKLGYRIAGLRYKSSQPTLISESGVVQPIISFEAQNNYDAAPIPLDTILSQLPRPDILVRVDLEPEVAFERYSRREAALGSKIEGTLAMFSRAQSTLDEICSLHLQKCGQVIAFNSAIMDHEAVAALAEKLQAAVAVHNSRLQ